MTEESFQQGRKVMKSINHLRGLITTAKGDVAKWTALEDSYRRQLKEGQANGAKKCIENAMKKLETLRAKFAEMKFPDSNIKNIVIKKVQCAGCGSLIAEGNNYCGECLCEDDSDY